MTPQFKWRHNNIARKYRAVADQVGSARTMAKVGGTGRTLIQTRTQRGVGVSGARFLPYSRKPLYVPIARRRPGYPIPAGGRVTKRGKSMFFEGGYEQYHAGLGLGSTPTLSLSGAMLGDIQVRAQEGLAVLYFGTALSAAKAHGHHFGTVVPLREWFDIDRIRDLPELERAALEEVRAYAREQELKVA